MLAAVFAVHGWMNASTVLAFQPAGIDFLPLWTAARVVQDNPARLYDFAYVTHLQDWILNNQTSGDRPFVYPPSALLFVAPFAQLPFQLANLLWTGLTCLAAAAITGLLVPGRRLLAPVLFLAAPATVLLALVGQTSFLVLALVAPAVFVLERRPWLAGALLGVAATLKPSVLILAPLCLIAARQYRALASAIVAGLAVGAMSMAAFGLQPWLDWAAAVPRFQADALARPSLLANMITPTAAALRLGLDGLALTLVRAAFAVAAIGLGWQVFRQPTRWEHRTLVLLAGGLMISPYAMGYEGAMLGPAAIALCLADLHSRRWVEGVAIFLLFAMSSQASIAPFLLVLMAGWAGYSALVRTPRESVSLAAVGG